ncbi:hypothetical protein FNV43_RR21057 [Rhamnella rubrinervis]|uniref:NB-ARC domain-containing protein n=1 Tax=Rhamnella rubrinervis TaxID=2594499 RepID=A0A8K0GXI3_9ROSA|nr:hypothetical protein FNV43_RR21057 [Rhamnella rubrinervis]
MKPYVYVAGMELLGRFTETVDEKLNKLKRKMEHLVSKEHDVKVELEYAEQLSMKKPRKEVENWLQEVGRTKSEVQDLEARIKEKGIFKNLTLRNSIDRHTTEVDQLIQRGVFNGGLTLQVRDSGVPLVTTELVGSEVAWVTVSQNCRILKLQDNIAKALSLGSLDEIDERKRAAVLASVLRKKRNFVLILDDIWDPIKLDEVGIPANEIGCKLIITTRSLDVCRMMNCEEIIKVEPLSENDPWELFKMHLGHIAILPSQIKEIAKSLVNEFGDYEIYREELIQHFIDEKLIPEMNTRRAQLNRGHTILNKLENSCVLERGERFGRKYVKMHDVDLFSAMTSSFNKDDEVIANSNMLGS